ncbi:MAG: TetR/AcrR family transcriptional regulator [Alphaproteobacteria bacterium]|nr:MAG: TetR/AcrR family transcriptional regulator [Alphaproteobacteria bacterium]
MVTQKTRNAIIDALLALAAEHRWETISLNDLAARAGVSLAQLRSVYDGRLAVLADFARRTDQAVLAGIDAEMAGEPARERLFDVLFARLEALAPYRQAIGNLGAAARRDPLLTMELNRIVVGSMGWMLTGAGIGATGSGGLFRAQGLALVWARVLRIWLDDEDSGLARTMAELDRRLRQGERIILGLERFARLMPGPSGRRRRARRDPDEAAPPKPKRSNGAGPRQPGVFGRGE